MISVSAFVIWGLVGVAIVYFIVIYNGLVRLKHNVGKAWSNIDVLLKQRHDELPKLVETCRQYMQYEQETLEQVMLARSSVATAQQQTDIPALGQAETQLRMGLGNLFAVAEQYPDLKTNETFQHLQARITGLENAIADRREFYNESVNNNNVRIEQFPDILVAKTFHFPAHKLLEFEEQETTDVSMRKLFQ